jgi:hypothetical protein
VQVESSRNGQHSVDIVAGGSYFISERDLHSTLSAVLAGASKYSGTEFSGRVQQNSDRVESLHRRISATNNTLYATISAVSDGNFLDQKRGWHTIKVYARVICVGDPDPAQFTADFLQSAGYSNLRTIKLHNTSHQNLSVDVDYYGPDNQWHTEGSWALSAGTHSGQLIDSQKRPVVMNINAHLYAQIRRPDCSRRAALPELKLKPGDDQWGHSEPGREEYFWAIRESLSCNEAFCTLEIPESTCPPPLPPPATAPLPHGLQPKS